MISGMGYYCCCSAGLVDGLLCDLSMGFTWSNKGSAILQHE